MAETLMRDRFKAAGIDPRTVRLRIALSEYRNNGGSYAELLAEAGAAFGMGSGGRVENADEAKRELPAAPQPHDGVGQPCGADQANEVVPAPSPHAPEGLLTEAGKANRTLPSGAPQPAGAGQTGRAAKAIAQLPAPARPPRRGLAAIASVQDVVAKSLFDQVRLPDGRRLREVHWAECPGLAAKYRRMSRILMAVHGRAVPADPAATLDTIISESGLAEIIGAVEKFNDIH